MGGMVKHESPLLVDLGDGRTPRIADDAWIAPGAVVVGDVVIGEGASVWYSATIRADTARITIGPGANVQDGVTVHADPGFPVQVGAGVSIGHNAVVHGAVIGDRSLIGMGAVLLNGSTIGAESLVAAGALVPEGMTVPAGHLVAGVPARVRRELTPEEREGLAENARHYLLLRDTHRSAVG